MGILYETEKEFDKLNDKEYFIDIITKTRKSKMKVLEYTLKGKNKETIIFNAHNCHPFQANDILVVLSVLTFRNLQKLKIEKLHIN